VIIINRTIESSERTAGDGFLFRASFLLAFFFHRESRRVRAMTSIADGAERGAPRGQRPEPCTGRSGTQSASRDRSRLAGHGDDHLILTGRVRDVELRGQG
jgi:hypothetical protein